MSTAAPDIGSLLAALGGGGASPSGMGGPSSGVGGPQDAAQGEAGVGDMLQQAFDLLRQASGIETDPLDRDMILKAMQAVHAIIAQEQKEKDQAMGGPGVRMIRRNR